MDDKIHKLVMESSSGPGRPQAGVWPSTGAAQHSLRWGIPAGDQWQKHTVGMKSQSSLRNHLLGICFLSLSQNSALAVKRGMRNGSGLQVRQNLVSVKNCKAPCKAYRSLPHKQCDEERGLGQTTRLLGFLPCKNGDNSISHRVAARNQMS